LDRANAFARVAEKRQVCESGFWGQEQGESPGGKSAHRNLPAFWSIASHGQPFNDERLTEGAANHWKVMEPPTLGAKAPKPSGPATESLASLHSSLKHGFALYNKADLSPKHVDASTMQSVRQYAPLAPC
jgi:hypothetical protein